MLYLSLTHTDIRDRFAACDATLFVTTCDTFVVTVAYKPPFATLTTTPQTLSLAESLPTSPHPLAFVSLQLDFATHSLHLFRPAFSSRPLYYHFNAQGEFFCSTHIAMLRSGGVAIKENREALPEFFVYRYITPPQTLYKSIFQLLVDSGMRIAIDKTSCRLAAEQPFAPFDKDKSEHQDPILETHHLSQNAIDSLLPLRDRVAVTLSGGLDSSILFALCRERLATRHTLSTSFPFEESANDIEKEYALSAAEHLHAEHFFCTLDNATYLHGLLESLSAAEEPLHHLQSPLFYLMLKHFPASHKDVIVSGLGADILFGLDLHNNLFSWHNHRLFYSLLHMPWMLSKLQTASCLIDCGHDLVSMLQTIPSRADKALDDPDNLVYGMGRFGDEAWVCDYFQTTRQAIIANRQASLAPFAQRSIYDWISAIGMIGYSSMTQAIWSKLAEASGKIAYYPYNDPAVSAYALTIPWQIRLKKPKYILRQVARRLDLPAFIITRPKTGFGIGIQRWAYPGGVFEPLVSLAAKAFDGAVLRGFQTCDTHSAMAFWNILNYALWKRLHIDHEPLATLQAEFSEQLDRQRAPAAPQDSAR